MPITTRDVGLAVRDFTECEGVELVGEYAVALWGVERNYPGADNSYLQCVANDLLPEALEQAETKLAALCVA